MNIPRVVSYGSILFSKFHRRFWLDAAGGLGRLGFSKSNFFSSLCNSYRSLESSKTSLNTFNPLLINTRGVKIKGQLQLRCKDCYFERKDGELYVRCSSYKRHEQKALSKRPKYTWILTYAFQTKHRPY